MRAVALPPPDPLGEGRAAEYTTFLPDRAACKVSRNGARPCPKNIKATMTSPHLASEFMAWTAWERSNGGAESTEFISLSRGIVAVKDAYDPNHGMKPRAASSSSMS